MSHQELSRKIPLYLAGALNAEERAELEAFAGEHVEFQEEIDELRPTFEALDRDFEAASRTTFKLSHARRAELRRATHANVHRFPAKSGQSGAKTGIGILRATGRVSRWAALAAALLMGTYLGLEAAQLRTTEWTPPPQLIAADMGAVETAPEQLPTSTYAYRPGYGLRKPSTDNPDIWSLPVDGQTLELAQAAPAGTQAFDLLEMFSPEPQWDPAYYGLDGPRTHYRFPSLRVRGAI